MKSKEIIINALDLLESGYSVNDVRSATGIGVSSIQLIKGRAEASKLTSEQLAEMSEENVSSIFYPGRPKRDPNKVMPAFELVYERSRNRKHACSLLDEWFMYFHTALEDEEEPVDTTTRYKYTQFKKHFHDWMDIHHPGEEATVTVRRKPGMYLYIDWVGDTPALIKDPSDPEKLQQVHILAATVGYSSLTWFEAYPCETKKYVAAGITRALDYYQAVPYALRPDNMKTAVKKNTIDKLVFSDMIMDLARHYKMEIFPCMPRKPKQKASVERAVGIIETEFLAKLDGRVFESFDEFNEAAAEFREKLNNRRKSSEAKSRKELYDQYDFPEMRPLPDKKFNLYEYTVKTVKRNCTVEFDRHFYSVPYTFCRKEVILKTNEDEIVICDSKNIEIARHERSYSQDGINHQFVINNDHLREDFRKASEAEENPQKKILEKAKAVGPAAERLIQMFISEGEFIQPSLADCRAVLRRCEKLGSGQADQIIRECLENGKTEADDVVKALLLKSSKKYQTKSIQEKDSLLPEHSNIRGREDYK